MSDFSSLSELDKSKEVNKQIDFDLDNRVWNDSFLLNRIKNSILDQIEILEDQKDE